jgi:hypothetical protein
MNAHDRLEQHKEAAAHKEIQQRIVQAGFEKVYRPEFNDDGSAKIGADGKQERTFVGYKNNMSPSDATKLLEKETRDELAKGDKARLDIVGANMASMGRSGSGALVDEQILNDHFGRTRDRTVDPSLLGEYAQTVSDMALANVDGKKHPTLKQPASVAEEGVSASDVSAMHYRGKEKHFVDITSPDIPEDERNARISETSKAVSKAFQNNNQWVNWNDQDKAAVYRLLENDQARAQLEDQLGNRYEDFRGEIVGAARSSMASGFEFKATPTPIETPGGVKTYNREGDPGRWEPDPKKPGQFRVKQPTVQDFT